jgi:hypothetical protein
MGRRGRGSGDVGMMGELRDEGVGFLELKS